MTEFCEHCPLRGETLGELVKLYQVNTVQQLTSEGEWVETLGAPLAVMIDEGDNISEPFTLPNDTMDAFERIKRRLATCDNRDLTDYSWLHRKLRERRCPAIGELAVKGRALTKAVKTHTKAQLL
jgi:hypothetical protein